MWSVGKACKDDGFTLIELIIVVILVGLMAALAAPAIGNSLSSIRLNTSIRRLSAVLRNTRSRAIADKQNYRISFIPEGTSYSYPTTSGDKSITIAHGIQIKSVYQADEDIEMEELNLYFYPKGNSNGGKIVLENEREQSFYLIVDAISGRVKIGRGEEEED